MRKFKNVSAGLLLSLLLVSNSFISQPVGAEVIKENQTNKCLIVDCPVSDSLQVSNNSGNLIVGLFRLVWRFATRGL